MTGPVPHGFPDFNRQLLTSDKLYLNDSFLSVDTFSKALGYVGNTQFLGTRADALAQGWAFNYLFYADQALATFLTSYAIEMLVGDELIAALPVLGPYMRVTGQDSAAGGQYSLQIWNVAGAPAGLMGGSKNNVLISTLAANIAGGGGSQQFDANTLSVTPLTLSINTASTNWTATLYAVNSIGTQTKIGFMANNLNPQRFNTTMQHLRVVVSNFQAGAATFDVMLTAEPRVG